MRNENNWYSEISKYFLDVSKFTLTAVLIVELFKGFERNIAYLWAIGVIVLCFAIAYILNKLAKGYRKE